MNKQIDRNTIKNIDSNWTKNVSVALLNNRWHRVVFAVVVIAMLFLVFMLFLNFSGNVTKFLKQDVEATITAVSSQSKDLLQHTISQATTNLHGMASAFAKYKDFSDPEILTVIEREAVRNNYTRISISGLDGNVITSDNQDYNISKREYFIKSKQGTANISNVLLSYVNGEKIIVYSVPIFRDNTVIGVLSAENSVKQLETMLTSASINKQSHTYITDKEGNVLIHPSYHDGEQPTDNVFSLVADPDSILFEQVLADARENKDGVIEFTHLSGDQRFAAYVRIPAINDWYSVSILPKEVLTEKTNYIISLTGVLLSIIAAILAIFAVYIYYVKRSSQRTFEFIAFTDEVTGCRSWAKFELDMSALLKKHKDQDYAFIYLNVQNFKYINDVLGHEAGNDLLRYISKVLSDNLNSNEAYTRIIADRFTMLIEYTNDSSIIKKLEQINKEIVLFRTNYDSTFALNLVFGIYKIKDKTLPANIISDRSLVAMESLNGVKDSHYGFYNSSIRQKALLEKELENEMQFALESKNFIVYLQPKFDLANGEIVGAEALVRWMHSKRGLIPPGNFISIFESNGFITKLDLYMFEETCKLLRKWIDSGKEPIPISVNLSKVHLYNPNIAEDLYSLALRYNIPTNLIEVELTESMNFENMTMLLNVVDRLKKFDFIISIDDFGTGYSSLNLLKDLPVDVLKIDREFLSEAADQKRGRQVLASIIDMAKRLDMKTVAEGVEFKEQADFLTAVNCDYVQGFFFSQPISINDFESRYIYNND